MYRRTLVNRLSILRRERKIHSFWTEEARIFIKLSPESHKLKIENADDIDRLQL